MKKHIDIETLEAFALDTLATAQAEEAAAHVANCDECKDELAWLRAERELMARRTKPEVAINTWPHVVAGMDATTSRRQVGRWFAFGGAGLLAAACALLLLLPGGASEQPGEVALLTDAATKNPLPVDEKDPNVVLAKAEHEYDTALDTLESAYNKKRQQHGTSLPPEFDDQLRAVRGNLAKARDDAGDDIGARVAVLDAYAGYLHSMQDTVYGLEEERR